MSAREHSPKIIPLPEINSVNPDRLTMNLNLPSWVDQNHIGVDFHRIMGLLAIAGIAELRVHGQNGPLERRAISVSGRDASGAAFAGLTSSKVEPSKNHRNGSQTMEEQIYPHCVRLVPHVRADLNIAQIADNLAAQGKNRRQADGWVAEIDKELRRSIVGAGTEHLLSINSKDRLDLTLLAGVLSIDMLSLVFSKDHNVLSTLLFNLASFSYANFGMSYAFALMRNHRLKPRLFNLPVGPELIGAALLQVAGQRPVMKTIPAS